MRALLQRVRRASVTVDGQTRGAIEGGLLVYLGVAAGDTEVDARYLAEKTRSLRIFEDATGKMNRSLADTQGAVLAVSQFTLLADARKGRRPSYSRAAPAETARALYGYYIEEIRRLGLSCEAGVFQARMEVSSLNDGPVTILLDSSSPSF
ncbi:MAG: D-tyrosyl-tRNA(Tyr) deacylase [Treponema sp.]|jgi:D-tyrosyl-tRNA(Tyr) deacylase|nr:D-tyrosyl-tRNA(Tyr) deacylase [Treponema sp.]